MKNIINKTSFMRISKRMLSCFLSFAVAVTMMCGVFPVEASAAVITSAQIEGAINWAYEAMAGYHKNPQDPNGSWADWCLAFVADAWKSQGISGGSFYSAKDALDSYSNGSYLHYDYNVPRGAVMFYDWFSSGHITISLGDGTMIHAYSNGITVSSITDPLTSNHRYRGWCYWGELLGYTISFNQQPTGSLEICEVSRGKIHVAGWAYDPDETGKSIEIHVYVGSDYTKVNVRDIFTFVTEKESTDITNAFGISGKHRFDVWHNTNASGKQPIYVYAIDTAGGAASWLRPINAANNGYVDNTYNIPANTAPEGVVDSISGGIKKITVSGWARDIDEPNKNLEIHIYIGGDYSSYDPKSSNVIKKIITTDMTNNDGGKHRFSADIDVSKVGDNIPVYIYAIDTDGGANTKISAANAKVSVVASKNLSDCSIQNISEQTYTGSKSEPTITVKDGNTTLTKGTHYKVEYSNNINAGTATAKISGIGNYTGTVTKNFIIAAKPVNGLTISAANQTYTGSQIKPAVTVKDGSKTLTSGTDFIVSYGTNTNVGTTAGTVTITGKKNYTGTKTISFGISPKNINGLSFSQISAQTYTGSQIKPEVTVKDGNTTLTENKHYKTEYSNNANVGTAAVKISGIGNYTGTKTLNFRINERPVTIAGIKVKQPVKTIFYIGENIDLTGSKVTVYYDYGEPADFDVNSSMISGYDSTSAGKKTVKVTYEGFTDTFEVIIKEKEQEITPGTFDITDTTSNIGGADISSEGELPAILTSKDSDTDHIKLVVEENKAVAKDIENKVSNAVSEKTEIGIYEKVHWYKRIRKYYRNRKAC